ncbi:MAG TPA: efflux RND transporter periplasmic adaptor subunit [Terriglobia bacterium]|nr:efflux RND transporter periplasmic adaptor subunit [Terriglobia bacterium]
MRINKNHYRAIDAGRVARFAAIAIVAALGVQPGVAAAQTLPAPGVVRAEEEVTIRSEFSGIVQRIAVREGDRVEEGAILVELKNERQKITLEMAQTGLAKARASVDETKVLLDNAEKELNRVKTAGAALPRKEFDDKSDQVLRLNANLNAQKAELAQAETEVKLREHELRETQLLAPFSGTVTQIFINRGDTLRPLDTPVMEIVALDDLYTEVLLPSSSALKVTLDQKLKVYVESEWMGRNGEVEGRVMYINPKVDAASRTFIVKIRIPNNHGLVRPGMLATVPIAP